MKSFILTIVAFLIVILTLNAGYYPAWFNSKPVGYWNDFLKERDDTLDAAGIMKSRYGISYQISARIKEVVEKKNVANPVILLEPNGYYRDSLHIYPKVRAPEPAVFYYYTGLEGVWINSPDVDKANFLVRVTKKGVTLDAIRSKEQLQQILAFYRKFNPIL
ncbi:MAG TPA: hypothetical protein VFE32_09420 [Puia sp.]|jgi:hypothetical protein|nr:hypothetical protein [Puia sp.]